MLPPRSTVRRIPGQAPITPEIAQAYQNDPRTQVARASVQAGIDGSPVAQGDYAWADGLARVMNGALGGYQDRRMRNQYGAQDDATSAELAATSQRRLEAEQALGAAKGMAPPSTLPPAPAMAPTPAQAPEQAVSIAKALGAPPAAMPPVAPSVAGLPPGVPPAPPPVSAAIPGAPQRGVAFTDPLAGAGRVTSAYGAARPNGRTHNGRDLAANAGTPVGAAAEGTVMRAWNDTANGGGNSVRIRHADGSITGYAHMANLNVRTGDMVAAGQPIGGVGSTGRSTGPHLHFTYMDARGNRVDPATLRFGAPEAAPEENASVPPPPPPPPAGEIRAENEDYGVPMEAMPTAPAPVGVTRSRGLQAGDEMAAGGNPYLVNRAQSQIAAGLDNQTALDEADANRRNDTNMIGYRAGLDRFATDRSQLRSQRYGNAERIAGQQFQSGERKDQNVYNSGERRDQNVYNSGERRDQNNFTAGQSAIDRASAQENLRMQIGSREEIERTRTEARRSNFFTTPTGNRFYVTSTDAMRINGELQSSLREFQTINGTENTGTAQANLGPLGRFGNTRLQRMNTISQRLAIDLSSQLKGALSNQDMQRVTDGVPSVTSTRAANNANVAFLTNAVARATDFQNSRLEAYPNPEARMAFPREWAAYTNSVPVSAGTSFLEWKARVPSYDAQGRRIP